MGAGRVEAHNCAAVRVRLACLKACDIDCAPVGGGWWQSCYSLIKDFLMVMAMVIL